VLAAASPAHAAPKQRPCTPSASPGYAGGVHWGVVNIARAVDTGMFCIYSNRVGPEGNKKYFGESMIVNPHGEVIATGGDRENAVVAADCDLALVDGCPLVAVHVLDRILDRDDVPVARLVEVIDPRGQGRPPSRNGGAPAARRWGAVRPPRG